MSSDILHPLILGIVQGLGEFLPISSTAHLVLVPYFFAWPDPGLAFDVALHFGTLISVLFYFWKDWLNIFQLAFKKDAGNTNLKTGGYGKNTLWFLIIATIPGALIGYSLENWAETEFRDPLIIASTLALFGLVLFLADRYFQRQKNIESIGFKNSFFIGIFQAFAIIPGISRSGATITAARLTGLSRESAARFSFLLSTPIIFGAFILKSQEFIKNLSDPSVLMAVIVSAFSGYLAIKYLLKLIAHRSYAVFFWYRLALAAIILIFYFFK